VLATRKAFPGVSKLDQHAQCERVTFSETPPWAFKKEVPDTMTNRVNEPMDQQKVEPRADLFYLLQKLSRVAEVRNCSAGVESGDSNEQMPEYKANGIQV
jgi:hypothetical protein